jgi:tRNA A37 methylthiotransferase MiaB
MDSGAYGLDLKTNLVELMEAISNDDSATAVSPARSASSVRAAPALAKAPALSDPPFLVRLGMINPNHARRLLPSIIRLLKGPRFYRFLHIPVQSGSEKVCRDMNRDHSVKDFVEIVEAVRSGIPDATIATDIIVGYPTETEEDFGDTVRLLETVKPDIINVSRFSPRPLTKANELTSLPNRLVKARSTRLAALVREISEAAKQPYIGSVRRVLITEKQGEPQGGKRGKRTDFTGRDVNYRQVVVKGFGGALGDFTDVEITAANHGSLFGKIIR